MNAVICDKCSERCERLFTEVRLMRGGSNFHIENGEREDFAEYYHLCEKCRDEVFDFLSKE